MAKVKAFFRQWFPMAEQDVVLFLGDIQGELRALRDEGKGR